MEYSIQAVSIVCAIASGAGIALQNLIFGRFVTVITNFASGESDPSDFRADAAQLAYAYLFFFPLVNTSVFS